MNSVTVIGLGAMGSTIAKVLLKCGCEVTVWNRSPEKADTLTGLGANISTTLSQAIEANEKVIICIHGYETTRELLDDPEITALLSGRTVIQMSTGTPAEARAAEIRVQSHGGHYLDCSIMVYPESVGEPEGQLLVSGRRELYDQCRHLLECLGGDVRYLGSSIGAAAALDLAVVCRLAANTIGIVYGIHICESEGLPLQHFAEMYPQGDRGRTLACTIDSDDFTSNISATVGTSIEVFSAVRSLAGNLGINTEFPDFMLDLYHRAAVGGFREQDNASLINVFRGSATSES